MQTALTHSHHRAQEELEDKGLLREVLALADAPLLAVAPRMASALKQHFEERLSEQGWANEPAVDPDFNLTINAMKLGVGLTVQTGNIARAFYDLLKFQAMYLKRRIDAAVLLVPSSSAAPTLGSNLANFGRVTEELDLFFHVITVPVFVVSFE